MSISVFGCPLGQIRLCSSSPEGEHGSVGNQPKSNQQMRRFVSKLLPIPKFCQGAADFLDGGRRLPIVPVCLSLLTTFVSGIGLLSVPAEIFTRGSAMALFNLCGSLAFPLIGFFFIPIFFKLKFINSYEYFEHRFQSRALRHLATFMFMVTTLVYMAVGGKTA